MESSDLRYGNVEINSSITDFDCMRSENQKDLGWFVK